MPRADAVAELRGVTTEQAAHLLAQADAEFRPELLVRDICDSLTASERVEFQAHVRAATVAQPDVAIVKHIA